MHLQFMLSLLNVIHELLVVKVAGKLSLQTSKKYQRTITLMLHHQKHLYICLIYFNYHRARFLFLGVVHCLCWLTVIGCSKMCQLLTFNVCYCEYFSLETMNKSLRFFYAILLFVTIILNLLNSIYLGRGGGEMVFLILGRPENQKIVKSGKPTVFR